VYPFDGDESYPVEVTCVVDINVYTSNQRELHTVVEVDSSSNYGYYEGLRLKEGWRCPIQGRAYLEWEGIYATQVFDWDKGGKTWFRFYVLIVDRDTGIVYIDASTTSTSNYMYYTSTTGGHIQPGHGGSCYSWSACPAAKKGEFSVNLQGTGLGISPATSWKATGWGNGKQTVVNYVETDSKRSGNCGAWCGECGPSDDKIYVTPAGLPDWMPAERR